jgi:hypothetical protein
MNMCRIVRAFVGALAIPALILFPNAIRVGGQEPVVAKKPFSAFDRPFTVPEITALPKDQKPFEYKDVGNQIPDYKGNKGGKKGSTLNLQQVPLLPEERAQS